MQSNQFKLLGKYTNIHIIGIASSSMEKRAMIYHICMRRHQHIHTHTYTARERERELSIKCFYFSASLFVRRCCRSTGFNFVTAYAFPSPIYIDLSVHAIYQIVFKAKQCATECLIEAEIIETNTRKLMEELMEKESERERESDGEMRTFDIKMACMFYAFNNSLFYWYILLIFSGLILLYISIVAMIITFINKITRDRSCAMAKRLSYRNKARHRYVREKSHKIFSSN